MHSDVKCLCGWFVERHHAHCSSMRLLFVRVLLCVAEWVDSCSGCSNSDPVVDVSNCENFVLFRPLL